MDYRRRKSIRLKDYDYSQAGAYFVTVCTRNRIHLFGEIIDGKMSMNESGCIVQQCWDELLIHYPQVELDAFVVMPNHIHAVVTISHENVGNSTVGARSPRPYGRKPALGNIIAYFKYQSTKKINLHQSTVPAKIWQRNYYDHIIRNENSLRRIRGYVVSNPERWQFDRENPDRIGVDEFDRSMRFCREHLAR